MPPDGKETELGSSNQQASPSASKNTGVILVACHTWKCVPIAISGHVDISEVPGCHLLRQTSSQWGSQKFKDLDLMISQATFLFRPINVNQVNLNHTTLLNLALRIFEFLVQILLNVNLSNSPDMLYLRQTWMTQSQILWRKPSFCTGLISGKLCRLLLMFSTVFTLLSVLLLFICRPSSSSLSRFWYYFI